MKLKKMVIFLLNFKGSSIWIFESKNTQPNPVDARIFWWSSYINLAIWVGMCLMAVFGLKFIWLVLPIIAVLMNAANVVGYTKCDKVLLGVVNSLIGREKETLQLYHISISRMDG